MLFAYYVVWPIIKKLVSGVGCPFVFFCLTVCLVRFIYAFIVMRSIPQKGCKYFQFYLVHENGKHQVPVRLREYFKIIAEQLVLDTTLHKTSHGIIKIK